MDVAKKYEELEVLNNQIKTISELRKQLTEEGSITLTQLEHNDLVNQLATTLVAFRFFLFAEHEAKSKSHD